MGNRQKGKWGNGEIEKNRLIENLGIGKMERERE